MNWDVLAAIAEIISAIAVVATLLFLAVEVRNNRRATEAASVDSESSGINSLNSVIAGDEAFAKVWELGLQNPGQLQSSDRFRFALHIQSYINLYIALRRHKESGALPVENWDYYAYAFSALMNAPGTRSLLDDMAIPPDIRAELERYRGSEASYAWLPKNEPGQ